MIRNFAKFALTGAVVLALSSCSMMGGGKKSASSIQYSPRVPIASAPIGVRVPGQLVVDVTYTTPALDNLRVAVRPRGNELEVYKGARWSNTPGEMMVTAVLRNLEAMQAFSAVGRGGSGLNPDYRLGIEIRNFESIYVDAGRPEATIVAMAKLVKAGDEKQMRSQEFKVSVPVAGTDVSAVVDGFAQGLGQISSEIATWSASGVR